MFSRAEGTEKVTVRIANGQTNSAVLVLGNKSLLSIRIPAAFTDGNLKILGGTLPVTASPLVPGSAVTDISDKDLVTVFDTPGTDYTLTIGALASRWVPVDYRVTLPFDYIILQSSVAQGQDTDIECLIRHI